MSFPTIQQWKRVFPNQVTYSEFKRQKKDKGEPKVITNSVVLKFLIGVKRRAMSN